MAFKNTWQAAYDISELTKRIIDNEKYINASRNPEGLLQQKKLFEQIVEIAAQEIDYIDENINKIKRTK